ncbi:alkaline phosphatase family protein [Lentisalinibacter orientalis]|uniref:alkaline phosphatase family protein n=1 Tax=Lentisalinibacter orientalis TaxID=2992241 RepID=UPI00386F6578
MRFARTRYAAALRIIAIVLAASLAQAGSFNAPEHADKPYVVLVSIDGFGRDFRDKTETPALDELTATGISATSLVPVYPTLTFPNHYSIATGLYPADHGLVANHFPAADGGSWYRMYDRDAVQDGSWYGGDPLWVVAEQNDMLTAAFFFVGTEADIEGIRPTYWYPYDGSVPGETRVDQVLDWLALPAPGRPHLVTLYFDEVDLAAHRSGPDSAETRAAIRRVDGHLGRLLEGIERLPVADRVFVIVVSDHGQLATDRTALPYVLSDHVDLTGVTTRDGSSHLNLWLDAHDAARAAAIRDRVNATWEHGRAWLRTESPAHWRVPDDDARFADIVLMAEPGHTVVSRPDRVARIKAGNHGWDPSVPAMHGIFAARGPGLPAGVSVGERHVTDVYPLVTAILRLPDARGELPVIRDPRIVVQRWREAAADGTD